MLELRLLEEKISWTRPKIHLETAVLMTSLLLRGGGGRFDGVDNIIIAGGTWPEITQEKSSGHGSIRSLAHKSESDSWSRADDIHPRIVSPPGCNERGSPGSPPRVPMDRSGPIGSPRSIPHPHLSLFTPITL